MSDDLQHLIDRLTESAPLLFRLDKAGQMIGLMCSEGRSPKMSIPVQWHDEDFFITTTMNQAGDEIRQLRQALEKIKHAQDLEEAVTIAYSATGTVPAICPYCGDDRTGKGSLIWQGHAFCNDDHFELWHAAVRAKQAEEAS